MSVRRIVNQHAKKFRQFIFHDTEATVGKQLLTLFVSGILGYFMIEEFMVAIVLSIPLLYWAWLRDDKEEHEDEYSAEEIKDIIWNRYNEAEKDVEKYTELDQVNLNDAKARKHELEQIIEEVD